MVSINENNNNKKNFSEKESLKYKGVGGKSQAIKVTLIEY